MTNRWLKKISIALISLALVAFALIERIDRTPLAETMHYQAWKNWIATQDMVPSADSLWMGWAKLNITPTEQIPMAGYGNRWGKPHNRVKDSLYVRAISIVPKGSPRALTFVSADLLIIPPNVTERLITLLKVEDIDIAEIHLGTVHTHHSFGGWGQKLAGRLFGGKYDEAVEVRIAEHLRDVIKASRQNLLPGTVSYQETEYPEGIRNRLGLSADTVDAGIRSLQFLREDSSRAEMLIYAAHSTTLRRDSLYLSRDYPGHVIDRLEAAEANDRGESNYFGVFFSGAVGSMGFQAQGDSHEERSLRLGSGIAEAHLRQREKQTSDTIDSSTKVTAKTNLFSDWVPVPLPEQTFRISKNFALRPWVFRSLFGKTEGPVKVSLISNTLVLGMPADFSGEISVELSEYAKSMGLDLIVISFNGYYTGYITHDRHYDQDLYETRTMSWGGYQNGDYYTEIAKDLIRKFSTQNEEVN